MFRMKIECQLNIKDRTLIGGVAEYNVIPKEIQINHKVYKVIGLSYGIKNPKVSLEIEKTENNLQGFCATAYYTYNISGKYDREEFKKTVELPNIPANKIIPIQNPIITVSFYLSLFT